MASNWLLKQTIRISDEMLGHGEIESKKPKSFATSNCVLVNAGNLLLRLIRLQSSFWVCICRTSFHIRQIYYQNQGIAEGKHDTLRLMDSKRPFKKMEEWIVGVHFKSPSKKINSKSFIFCHISCVKVVIFLTNSINLLVTEKWNVTVTDCLLLDVQVLDFWEY